MNIDQAMGRTSITCKIVGDKLIRGDTGTEIQLPAGMTIDQLQKMGMNRGGDSFSEAGVPILDVRAPEAPEMYGVVPAMAKAATAKRSLLPPGIDIHRQLVVNKSRCRGKLAKRAMRKDLKAAKKEQMKLLKEEGYFDKKPAAEGTATDFNSATTMTSQFNQ